MARLRRTEERRAQRAKATFDFESEWSRRVAHVCVHDQKGVPRFSRFSRSGSRSNHTTSFQYDNLNRRNPAAPGGWATLPEK